MHKAGPTEEDLPAVLDAFASSVQHPHAHIASCMAENGVTAPVILVAFDNADHGEDQAVWGGEFFLAGYHRCRRMGQLQYPSLPGRAPLPFSMTMLFDAVSTLIGEIDSVEFEVQTAIELGIAVSEEIGSPFGPSYPFEIRQQGKLYVVHLEELLAAIQNDLSRGCARSAIAARFHHTVAQLTSQVCQRLSWQTGVTRVALSGEVFQNLLLLQETVELLEGMGFSVLTGWSPATRGAYLWDRQPRAGSVE